MRQMSAPIESSSRSSGYREEESWNCDLLESKRDLDPVWQLLHCLARGCAVCDELVLYV